ncbi:hypothetical protein V493_05850 [Pseudogymnoascus sp. VKM F-4281 (FW-2241)]|nr:hypothetical protein V493_05850 [Pseudogymnoascus sp. VKM F-4281 (FW-2241)]
MDSTKAKGDSKEKLEYDTTQDYKPKTPTMTPTKTPAKSPAKAPMTPPNEQGEYTATQPKENEEGETMCTESQGDYISDYIRRLRERYAEKPEKVTELVEQLCIYEEGGLERWDLFVEVCRIMRDSPDLCVEFLDILAPRGRPI